MKNKNYNTYNHLRNGVMTCLTSFLTLTACVNYDDTTQAVDLTVSVENPTEFVSGSDLANKTISLTSNGKTISAVTNNEGIAIFSQLIPNVYTLSTSWNIDNETYERLTGDNSTPEGAVVTGDSANIYVKDNSSISLRTRVLVNRNIVIGKVYNNGSRDKNNRIYQAGKYIELYNQSEQEVDVAGLYIGLTETNSTNAYTLDNISTQYNDTVVLLKQVFRIPNNKEHKVKPGGTVLIVNSAIDHTAQSTFENNLTVANFEAKDARSTTQNNPDVPAIELIYTNAPALTTMNLVQGGPCGVVLFKTEKNISTFEKVYAYGTTRGSQYLVLPTRYVLDAVEILKKRANGVDTSSKRMVKALDAGYINGEATNGGTGEVFYRKIANKNKGYALLQDTNNSTNDFKVSTSIKIGNYEE